MGTEIFAIYHSIDQTMGDCFAAQLTEENMSWFARIAKVNMIVGNDGVPRLFFADDILGSDSAEPGDYVITDMAGRYWPFDKELFEDSYKR